MRFELNMATRPFGRRRLVGGLSGLAAVLLTAAAVVMVVIYSQQRELPPELTARQGELRAELAALGAEEAKLRRTLQDPANSIVLERSLFLNRLLHRKGISWTKTFADLETILPPRVQMMQIRPEVTDSHNVALSMQVGAETPADFIELLIALETSELFDSPNLRGSAPPSDNQPLFRYQLTVSYDQQL